MLRRTQGLVLLSPDVHSLFPDGEVLLRPWPWFIYDRTARALFIQNITTGHLLEIPFAEVRNHHPKGAREYQTLNLRKRPWITRTDAKLKSVDWSPSEAVALSGVLR